MSYAGHGEALVIRRAGVEAAEMLGRIHALAWQAAYRGIAAEEFLQDFTPQRRTAFFQRILPDTKNEHYLLEWQGKPVGMLALGPQEEGEVDGRRCGEVIALYLLPEHVGQGIGKRTLHFALDRLRALGFADAVLTVLSENTRALRLYRSFGFVPDGEEEPFWMGRPVMERRYRCRLVK